LAIGILERDSTASTNEGVTGVASEALTILEIGGGAKRVDWVAFDSVEPVGIVAFETGISYGISAFAIRIFSGYWDAIAT
jgi:hypothetical protein